MTAASVRKVLVVAPFYPPLQSARSIQAERAVAAMQACGLDVRLVTGRERRARGTIVRVAREAALFARWTWLARVGMSAELAEALDGGWRPDVVLSMSVPFDAHLAGKSIARRLGVPWAAFLSDPYPVWLAPGPYSAKRKPGLGDYPLTVARRVLAGADALLAPTQEMLELQRSACPALADVHGVETLHCAVPLMAEAAPNVAESICHVGQLTAERCSHALLAGIRSLAKALDHKANTLVFVGDVDSGFRSALRAEEESGFLRIVGKVDVASSQQYMVGARALLLIEADMQGSPFLPSKITDYAAAGRPIVIVSNHGSALGRITGECPGIRCVPHDQRQIHDALLAAAAATQSAESGASAVFDPDAVGSCYLRAFEHAIRAGRRK